MLLRRCRDAKILSEMNEAERSWCAQRPGKRPPPPRKPQARQAGMQVRTPAGQPGLRIGPDDIPYRYQAKQTGLGRTFLAAYTGTHHRRIRGMLLSSYGHPSNESTASAHPWVQPGMAPVMSRDGSHGRVCRVCRC
jgi:hypothetical protein